MNNDITTKPIVHQFKEAKVIPADRKQTWLKRHVKWLKGEHHGLARVGVFTFSVLEKLVLALSVVGIILLKKEWRESKRQDAQAAYFKKAAHATRPSDQPIELKSKTRSFNHIQDFAIEGEILWMRARNSNEDWKPVFFDGQIEGLTPQSLDCDGSNLIVLDEKNKVHYKKVLKEYREIDVNKSSRGMLTEAGVDFKKDAYVAVDKGDRDNWKDKWFSLPVLNHMINLFTGKRLTIPSKIKAWAISQRGRYNDYLEDQSGKHHQANVGVTTLYALDENGKDIFKFDPWSPKYVRVSIPLPETSEKTFEAENISVGASHVMAIGYETEKNNPQTRTLQIYSRLADIDSEGWNPGLKYDYFDTNDPEIHVVPLSKWINHPLKLEAGDFVTQSITVLQAGAGNNERELRVEGQHGGKPGFFFKKVEDKDWQFEPFKTDTGNEIDKTNALSPEKKGSSFESTVHNYKSEKMKLKNYKPDQLSASLTNFGERSFHSKLVLKLGDETFELDLYKKKTLKNFLGFKGNTYELVIPETLHNNEKLKKAFKGQKIIPLKVKENQSKVSLHGSSFSFDFTVTS